MVSGARREGRKQGALIKPLSSCLRQAASPLQGEAREGKGIRPVYGLQGTIARLPGRPGRDMREADNMGAYGPPRLGRYAPQAKENEIPPAMPVDDYCGIRSRAGTAPGKSPFRTMPLSAEGVRRADADRARRRTPRPGTAPGTMPRPDILYKGRLFRRSAPSSAVQSVLPRPAILWRALKYRRPRTRRIPRPACSLRR